MAKRYRDTEIWDNEWYMSLPCHLKCLVDYVRDKCDISGVWTPNWVIANAYINHTHKVTESDLLSINDGKQFKKIQGGKIYCLGFVEFQYVTLSLESRVHVKVLELAMANGTYDQISHLIVEKSETIQAKRSRISEKMKRRIFGEDEYKCQYCGGSFAFGELCLDHIVPLSIGGDNEDENLTTACRSCNAKKHETDVFEFIANNNLRILNSLYKKLNTLSKKLDRPQDKDKEEDKEKDLEKEKVKDSSEGTVVIKTDIPNPWVVPPLVKVDDQFADYEYWTEQIIKKQDQYFEQLMMAENLKGDIDLAAHAKAFLVLLAQYPNKKPPTQHRFRVALIGHIVENMSKPNGSVKPQAITDRKAKAREL